MAKPVNPWLAQLEAKAEAKLAGCLMVNAEVDRVALMMTLHSAFQVGPGRAKKLLNDFVSNKDDVAQLILDESKDDPEILKAKRDIAGMLKEIFGPDWDVCREWFPFCKEYW